MKVTRYTQSCLLIEDNNHRIIIDPAMNIPDEALQGVEAVLYTHEHSDHYDAELNERLLATGVKVYANGSTARLIGTEKCTVVNSLDSFDVAGFTVVAYDLPHCQMPNGDPGPQNTGYAVNSTLFHPGDGTEFAEPIDLQVPVVAVPIVGPDISFYDAYQLAIKLKATQVIPIHYDAMGGKPEIFANMSSKAPFKVVVLENGKSVDIS